MLQVANAIAYERALLGEPNAGQRWSDSQLIMFNDRAQKLIMRDVKFPPTHFNFNTMPGVQEYVLDSNSEVIRILRVSIQGQPLVRTDIETLQGQQIQFDDQTGSGGGYGALGSVIAGPMTPQWSGEPSQNYPVSSNLGYPSPDSQPGYPGQRPRYYLYGSALGFVPAPAGSYQVRVDCVKMPPQLTATTDYFQLPDGALDAIAWYVVQMCYTSDRTEAGSGPSMENAAKMFDAAIRDFRTWVRQYSGFGPRGPKPLTYRTFGPSTIRRGC